LGGYRKLNIESKKSIPLDERPLDERPIHNTISEFLYCKYPCNYGTNLVGQEGH
jgi:hypothetical protein